MAASVALFAKAKNEYTGILRALAEDDTIVLVTVGVVFLIIAVFIIARLFIAYRRAGDAQVLAERKAARLREQNLQIKEELQR